MAAHFCSGWKPCSGGLMLPVMRAMAERVLDIPVTRPTSIGKVGPDSITNPCQSRFGLPTEHGGRRAK